MPIQLLIGIFNKKRMSRFNEWIKMAWGFLTHGIWRITDKELPRTKSLVVSFLKVIILAIRGFSNNALQTKSAALTYFSILSFIPALALLLAIASGFGYKSNVTQTLFEYFPGQREILEKCIGLSESYLSSMHNEIFIGVGLILLVYTVFNLISVIEHMFNDIWQVSKDRMFFRKFTDYLAIMIFLPALLLVSSGLSIFISTFLNQLREIQYISPLVSIGIKTLPFIITILIFTILYIFIPNTKVRFTHAFYAGIVVGVAFQVFQFLYISGQIWVGRYGAIYGQFAAVPLFLLWLNLSWLITLFGAKLAFAGQNYKQFDFEKESKRTSRRFKDFTAIVLTTIIVKSFNKGDELRTLEDLSEESGIPLMLAKNELNRLVDSGLLIEMDGISKNKSVRYMPAIDIHSISIGLVLKKLDELGDEDFKVDVNKKFTEEWNITLVAKEAMFKASDNTLLMNLQ